MPCFLRQAVPATRRETIVLLGTMAASTISAGAQQKTTPVIGYLGSESPEPYASRLAAFAEGLAEAGYVDGRNVAIDFRWAEGRYSRLPALAVDLADRQVTVMVAPGGAEVALAARSATKTIPIVFELGGDPVALGLVASLSRPGGNLTGVSSLSVEVSLKRLEFMSELFPAARTFAVAVNPTSPTSASQSRNLQAAAGTLGLELRLLNASSEPELEALFAAVPQMQLPGLVFTSDPYFAYRSRRLAELAMRYKVPAITQARDFPNAGGLMSYGGDFRQSHRHTGIYAGRIIKGEKPSDLPVQRVTKLELFVNLKAAEQLGLTMPPSVLSSADVVIE
ncbi:putative ABC transport system substrate-binding protein [Bosea sp. 62]|nr:putative ABC transport system substrate-binding protein [Bosea sp. 7B]CAD5276448.1 putative ABC transport system substrate-binding protein [Bosea sp. 21B]CAD5277612.1 putative ABC transport system substrate-binding protein [Bosea sp. 46]VVT59879.1 putative ABC transport system substrate-binding protein [Bosea sp. EC-HK365B]VXB47198.1 putative ABC transport system substrate-binding protein [Bosea sp. 62]VXC08658.1 putative ABC transport system substrate-binding protein [Bosea sp. 127]VXC221